ncbi:MAG TPA: TPM domain-containing protein [Aestuariivirga sp.]
MHFMGHDLSEGERKKVTLAISAAEAHTTGEIVVVAAHASDDYIHVPIHIATGLALAVPLVLWLWQIIHPWDEAFSLVWLFAIQLIVFIAAALALSLPSARRAITPMRLKHKYAHRNAAAQFLASNITHTSKHTGVLIFVSLLERYVEVIGDEAIAAKLNASDWQKIIDEMLPLLRQKHACDALVLGVQHAGALLAKHFPAKSHGKNQLPNRFIVLD